MAEFLTLAASLRQGDRAEIYSRSLDPNRFRLGQLLARHV